MLKIKRRVVWYFIAVINAMSSYIREASKEPNFKVAQEPLNPKQTLFLALICQYYYEGGDLGDVDSLKDFIKNESNSFNKNTDIATYKSVLKNKKWIHVDEDSGAINIVGTLKYDVGTSLNFEIEFDDEIRVGA